MTKHSDRAIRQRMRERGIPASKIDAVRREVNSTERERALSEEASRAGFAVNKMGRQEATERGRALQAEAKRRLNGGRPI